jgi:hypothetical protein
MNIGVFSALFILLCVSAGYPETAPSGSSSVLYEDEFGFTGDLNGRMPVTTTGSSAWTSANFEANGSSVAATVPFRTAYLPFMPREGFIYTLSASLSIGTNASSWVSLGFNSPSPNTNLEFSGDGGIGTVILRNSGQVHWFPGPGSHGLSSIPVADDL